MKRWMSGSLFGSRFAGRAHAERSRKRRRLKNERVRSTVVRLLVDEHWSPGQIELGLGQYLPGQSISARTIYNFLKYERIELRQYLPEKGRPRRQRVMHRRGRFR